MDKKNSPMFRMAINGFNKSDVNDYIAHMAKECDEKVTALEDEISKLKAKLEDAEEASAAIPVATEPDTVKSEALTHAECIIASQTEQLDVQKAEIERLSAELASANEKLTKYSDIEAKIDEYEAMSAKMGSIFMGAAAEAEKIKTSAQEEADKLILATEEECNAKIGEAQKNLLAYAASQRAIIDELFDTTHKSITNVLDAYEKKAQSMIKESRLAMNEGSQKSDSKASK